MPSARRRVSLAALTLATLAAASCMSPPRPPAAPVRDRLAPGAEASAPLGLAGPLRVVFGAPDGEITPEGEVTLVFNKPMRPLGQEPSQPAPPVRMTPEVPGSWRWIGSSALRFTPAKPLPRATAFRVEIDAGARALDGSALEQAFVLGFSTPRPALSGSEPAAGATGVLPDAAITLFFNAPVTAEEVARAVTLRAPRPLPFTIAEIEGERVRLKPTSPLPRAAEVKITVDASLRGVEGGLTAGKSAEASFRTLDPLAVSTFACKPHPTEQGACDPLEWDLSLALNNPVAEEDLVPAVSVEPEPDQFGVYAEWSEQGAALRISGSFEPAKTYRVKLRARQGRRALADVHGQALPADVIKTFRFGDLPPSVTLGARGTYWFQGPRVLPVGVTNAEDASVVLLPLGPDQALARLAGLDPALGTPSKARPFAALAGKRNEAQWSRVRIDDLWEGGAPRGPALLRARYRAPGGSDPRTEELEVQLTDIGLLSKVAHDEAAVWVTRLPTGGAIAGTRVEVHSVAHGKKPLLLGSGVAGADGLARLSLARMPVADPDEDGARIAVIARNGDDWAYQALRQPATPPIMGQIFSERGLYRPGERVQLKGIVRLAGPRGLVTPAGREVVVRVKDGASREVASFRTRLTRFGTFAVAVPLRDDAHLGFHHVEATLDGQTVHGRFGVQEYQPVQSKVGVETDHSSYMPGDRMLCTASGEYLYGAPMAGARATITATRASTSITVPGLDDEFKIGEHDANMPTTQLAKASGTLDARGKFTMPIPLDLPGQTSTEEISCHVEIADLNREVLASMTSAIVHPTDVYVALDRERVYSVNPGDTLTPRVLVVTPAGQRRAQPVRLELTRRIRREDRSIEEQPAGGCDVTSGNEPVSCALTAPKVDPGEDEEIVVRAVTKDAHGRRAASSYAARFEPAPKIAPPPPPTQVHAPPTPPAPELEVVIKGTHFSVGERLRMTIASPFAAEAKALVTIQREGILLQRMVTLPPHGAAPTAVEIPITDAMMPNAQVVVDVIAGSESKSSSHGFYVDASPRRLEVDVHASKEVAAPGEAVDVEVSVRDNHGKPARAEVTLWAADEGTLALSYYRTPEPWSRLFEPRHGQIVSADARDDLVTTFMSHRRAKPPQIRMGATSVVPRRGDFRQTVAFFPDLVTDAKGKVRRRITLPDGLTSYRFMAVAVTEDDRAGSGDENVKTIKPLMARPTLPRVIRTGDQFEASVVVSSFDLPASTVTVRARSSSENLVATGSVRKTLGLYPDKPAEVRFPFRATRTGPAKLSFDAAAHGRTASDAVDLAPRVMAPAVLETAAIHGETGAAVAERLGNLKDFDPTAGGLTLSLSSTPLSGLAQGIEQLIEYPYGCTEQTVSRMVPLLALRDLADSLGVRLPKSPPGPRPGGELAAELGKAVASVLANQRPDGGFGLWPTSGESSPWVTAYALWGLGEARRRGLPVREETLRRAEQWLARTPEKELSDRDLAQAAFTVHVLAEDGRPDIDRTAALYAARARMPLFARALLLHAMARSGRAKPEEVAELSRELAAAIRIDGPVARVVEERRERGGDLAFDSDVRSAAMVLRALLAVDPAHPLAARLALGLLEARSGGTWRTTHDAAWALLALDAYRRAQPEPASALNARVFLGEKLLADVPFGADAPAQRTVVHVPMANLLAAGGAPLTFASSGRGKLFYEAALRFAPKQPSAEPVDAGFYVQKSIRPVAEIGVARAGTAGPLEATLKAGEVVLCEVEIVTPAPRRFVVIEDPLPGGLEAVRFDHRKGAATMAVLEETPAERRELRDDRVVYFVDALPAGVTRYRYLARATHIGTFTAPATRVEEMYAPEIHGRTASGRVQVTGN